VIDISMIPVTNDPMEGVAFDVQDHARWICAIWTITHGEMINSNLHGAKDPTRWILRPHQGEGIGKRWKRGFAPEKNRTFH
jgi:hypothetical protein